jgi:hypothetical protein
MARLGSVSTTASQAWDEYKGWFFLLLSGYVLWSIRGVFTALNSGTDALFSGLKEKADAAAAEAKAKAEVKASQAKAKASNGGGVDFTPTQIAAFTADAESLATYLGRGSGFGLQNIFRDQQSAFSLLKQRYSRLNLVNNKPVKWANPKTKILLLPQTAETKDSIKNAINWRVLIPFYKDASGGHDLQADIRYYITDSKYKQLLKWIL